MGGDEGEGTRVAIVGAGPAGCLMAAALLDAARARRRPLSIQLFGARPFWGPDRPLVVDDASATRLTSLGIPLPAGKNLDGMRTVYGKEEATASRALAVLPRNRMVTLLRASLLAQGVAVHEKKVTDLSPTWKGGWMVRAEGASVPVDWVILACGAGASIGTRIQGHRPPPTWKTCIADLPTLSPRPFLFRYPKSAPSLGDLWIVPHREGIWAAHTDENATSRDLARGLIERAARGEPISEATPSRLLSYWIPAGVGAPGVPCLGSALGGPNEGSSLADVSRQAGSLAVSLLDGGMAQALASSRREARSLSGSSARRRRDDRRWRSFPERAKEVALRREKSAPGLPGPVEVALGSPGCPSLRDRLLAWFALILATVFAAWESLLGPKEPRREMARSSEIFVVEDDPAQAEGLSSFLQSRGFRCRTFPDAMQASYAAIRHPPAVLVMDLALPWIDGTEALRLLEAAGIRGVPVVVTSSLTHLAGNTQEGPRVEAFFPKPVDLEELVRRLSRHSKPGLPPERERASPPWYVEKR